MYLFVCLFADLFTIIQARSTGLYTSITALISIRWKVKVHMVNCQSHGAFGEPYRILPLNPKPSTLNPQP